MAAGSTIRTCFEGKWHDGNLAVLRAEDHAMWLGSSVFDGARLFDGATPDLDLHCARTNASAQALMMTPMLSAERMVEVVREGLEAFAPGATV